MIRHGITLIVLLFALVLAPLRGMGNVCGSEATSDTVACVTIDDCCATMTCCTEAPKPEPVSTMSQKESSFVARLAVAGRLVLYTLPPIPTVFPAQTISFSANALAPLAASGVLLL